MYFSGKIYALDSIWVLGDIFMAAAAQKINAVWDAEQKDKLPSYIDERYDLKYIFTPVATETNFLLRILNALVGMINLTLKLPRILILMLDSNFVRITAGYGHTERAIAWLVSHFIIKIEECKSKLLKKAFRKTEPKILIMKPTLRAASYEHFRGVRNQRQIFNHSLETIIVKHPMRGLSK